ncbi:MAG TPA: ABC transporter substrate-binding protein [Acidimicrobiales bacterium]|nr:ABC transporter substrate-binding protein [Acidimicrobiales bacterium]
MTINDHPARPVSRRTFLRGVSAGAAALGAGVLLDACGSAKATSPASGPSGSTASGTATTAAPKRGGRLTAGLTGGSSSDTLDAQQGVNNVDFSRLLQLYNPLVAYNSQVQPTLALAEEFTPNSTATQWTVRVKKGVTFHDGKPFTADDVLFSITRVVKGKLPGSSMLPALDLASMKKLDTYTVLLPFHTPYASVMEAMAGYSYYLNMVPVGYDPKHPVGTGPFKYKSFTPGVQSVFVRNPDYWEHGLPYLDEVVVVDYADANSQLNALQSGQADVINLLSADVMGTVESSGAKVVVSPAGGFTPFTMRVDQAPFNDVRVRQAFRLIANRPQMNAVVFEGRGLLGNDIFSIYDPEYDRGIAQREQDIAQARSLLKSAGQEGLTVQLVTSDIAQGTLGVAQVFAQQAAAANVKVNLRQVNVTEFYGSNYLKWTFAQDYWYFSDYLPQVGQATLPTSPFNETHFDNARYNALYQEAVATLDKAKQAEITHEMQHIDWTEGGYIIPYFPPVIDGHAAKVQGVLPGKTGLSLNSYGFKSMWLD